MSENETNAAVLLVDYLDDGYMQQVGIPAEDGVHNALSIEFRPCLAAETSKAIDAAGDESYIAATIELLADKLKRWNLKDRGGRTLPINKTTLARVKRALLVKVIDAVVFGKLPDGARLDVEADLKN
jgi:hypothetical protein